MAEIAKYMNVDIDSIAKIFGVDKDSINKFGGVNVPAAGGGVRGVFGGGPDAGGGNTIDYITISTTGDATDFGDLTRVTSYLAAASNGVNDRGLFIGGGDPGLINIIDYITISSIGNAADFGDLTQVQGYLTATDNGTGGRAIAGGGKDIAKDFSNIINYITITTLGNSNDFGDLTQGRRTGGSCSNDTNNRAIFGGGDANAPSYSNVIDYVTITSLGNATDFGDLTVGGRNGPAGTSNGTSNRGVFGGGTNRTSTLDYVNIASTGNATNFGSLSGSPTENTSVSSKTADRGVYGRFSLYYITISSTGNTTFFGNLTSSRARSAGTSNA